MRLPALPALPSPARLLALTRIQSSIFQQTFNPLALKTGSKVLRKRLVGPSMTAYYGERMSGWKDLMNKVEGLQLVDLHEEQRLEDLAARRRRGKVTPKKGQGRRASMKKR